MDDNQNGGGQAAEKVVAGLQKDFKIVGSHRVHPWFAWATVGIVLGLVLGGAYVVNKSGEFSASEAAQRRQTQGQRAAEENFGNKEPGGLPYGQDPVPPITVIEGTCKCDKGKFTGTLSCRAPLSNTPNNQKYHTADAIIKNGQITGLAAAGTPGSSIDQDVPPLDTSTKSCTNDAECVEACMSRVLRIVGESNPSTYSQNGHTYNCTPSGAATVGTGTKCVPKSNNDKNQ